MHPHPFSRAATRPDLPTGGATPQDVEDAALRVVEGMCPCDDRALEVAHYVDGRFYEGTWGVCPECGCLWAFRTTEDGRALLARPPFGKHTIQALDSRVRDVAAALPAE